MDGHVLTLDERAQVDARLLASERDERLWSAFGRLERLRRAYRSEGGAVTRIL
jgi:hypothetical protein